MEKTPIEKIIAPVSRFIQLEYTSGLVLLAALLAALFFANSPWHSAYHNLLETPVTIGVGLHHLGLPLHGWINDGLMAIFFFVIGLELKREFLEGELSSLNKALLPMTAAFGGMLLPALIYFVINQNSAASHGWGIPMATDIAFALAVLSMAGKHLPNSIKVFLSALAVADDLGAVLVIAIFYTSGVNFLALSIAGIFLLVLVAGNLLGVRNKKFYLIIGFCVWVCFLLSGVHATLAGVLVAFTIPAATRINEKTYSRNLRELSYSFEQEIPNNGTLTTQKQLQTIQEVKTLSLAAETPLQKMELALHPWVAFVIMPLFALANAGIVIESNFLGVLISPVSLGVMSGLVIGKFFGILIFSWLMIITKLCKLPEGSSWGQMAGVALLGGIGFTMSLFISNLAFAEEGLVRQAKSGIFVASIIAAVAGSLILRLNVKHVLKKK